MLKSIKEGLIGSHIMISPWLLDLNISSPTKVKNFSKLRNFLGATSMDHGLPSPTPYGFGDTLCSK
jgi:hypothetical protein